MHLRDLPMQRYANLSGDSGVVAYALLPGAIVLQFSGGELYLYDGERPGPRHVARMQRLARAGRGLSSYVSRHVRECYRARSGDG